MRERGRRGRKILNIIENTKSPLLLYLFFFAEHPFLFIFNIIESVGSISRDEPDSPLTQYITNAGISRARYTITHFKNTTIVFYG